MNRVYSSKRELVAQEIILENSRSNFIISLSSFNSPWWKISKSIVVTELWENLEPVDNVVIFLTGYLLAERSVEADCGELGHCVGVWERTFKSWTLRSSLLFPVRFKFCKHFIWFLKRIFQKQLNVTGVWKAVYNNEFGICRCVCFNWNSFMVLKATISTKEIFSHVVSWYLGLLKAKVLMTLIFCKKIRTPL